MKRSKYHELAEKLFSGDVISKQTVNKILKKNEDNIILGSKEFTEIALLIVKKYVYDHLDKTDSIEDFKVYVVWYCKTLQNHKTLISTSITDGMYYEVTYNGDKDEFYLDSYKKFENQCLNRKLDVEALIKEMRAE